MKEISIIEGKDDLFIDMDGVLCDYSATVTKWTGITISHPDWETTAESMSNKEGFFADIVPMPGAVDAYNLLCMHYNVYILSTPAWDNPHSYKEKREWIHTFLGDLAYKKLILTHNKGLMVGRALIDDRTKNGASNFKGEHIHFGTDKFPDWDSVLKYLIS